MHNSKPGKLLRGTLYLDFVITLAFGLYSFFHPYQTFGTVVAINDYAGPAMQSVLGALSVMYVLVGLSCLIVTQSVGKTACWFGLLMLLRHSWVGINGYQRIGAPWLIGDPWPDIIIHALFVSAYGLGVCLTVRAKMAG